MFYENMRKSYPNLVDPVFVFLTAFSTNAFNSYIKSLKVQYCFEKPMSGLLMKRLLFLVQPDKNLTFKNTLKSGNEPKSVKAQSLSVSINQLSSD